MSKLQQKIIINAKKTANNKSKIVKIARWTW